MIVQLSTGIGENIDTDPYGWNIGQNYPNPFNGSTIIPYTISAKDDITIEFFDTLGRNVGSHALGIQEGGAHLFTWDARSGSGAPLSSGIYYSVVKGKTHTAARKLVLVQ
jgi:hypothetical protein